MENEIYRDHTDYTHLTFDDLSDYLENKASTIDYYLNFIEKDKEIVVESGYWNEKVLSNFIYQADECIRLYNSVRKELRDIKKEIQIEVQQNHYQRLLRIAKEANQINRRLGEIWHREYDRKEYGNADFKKVERVYGFSRDLAVTLTDLGNFAERLKDYIGRTGDKKQGSAEFNIYEKWWLMSLIVFGVAFIISIILIKNFKYSLILGLIAGVITLFRNPRRRFNRMFWSVFGVFVSVNYLSLNLIVNYLKKTEDSNLDLHFSLKEPAVIISILLIMLMGYLAFLDFKEGKK